MTEAVSRDGLVGLHGLVTEKRWEAPIIPSKWRLDREKDMEMIAAGTAAREFGRLIVVELERQAPLFPRQVVGAQLAESTAIVSWVAHWCGNVQGYGNALIARRATDLVSVGVARIVADESTTPAECDRVAALLSQPWNSLEWREAILNYEAGAPIFTQKTQEALEEFWRQGLYFTIRPAEKADVSIRDNKAFFDDIDPSEVHPQTLLNLWDKKFHAKIVTGLSTMNITQALGLYEFRKKVGHFPRVPEKIPLTAEQKKAVEWETNENQKRGIKTVPFESGYSSPQQAAFAQAWEKQTSKREGDSSGKKNGPATSYASAWYAYSRVMNGDFIDLESEAIKR